MGLFIEDVITNLKAYNEGYIAYELEYNTDDNPYEIGTDNYNQWLNGFEDAEQDTP